MNILRVTVEDPAELLNASAYGTGALIRAEYSADNVTFFEFTTTAIVSGTNLYTIYHTAGTSTTWYRTRYSDAAAAAFSGYSDAFRVATPPVQYVTLPALKLRLGKQSANDDAVIETICDQINAWIEGRTGRSIGPDSTTSYTLDGRDALEGHKCLLFPRGMRSVSLLQVAAYTGDVLQTIPASDYFLRPSDAERMPGWPCTEIWITNVPSAGNPLPYFPDGYNNVVVTGTFGWAAVPAQLSEAAEVIAARAYLWRQAGHNDVGGDDVGQWLGDPNNIALRYRLVIDSFSWKPVPII